MPSTSKQPERRDRRVAVGGAAIAAVLLAFLLWPAASSESAVDLVPATQRTTPAAAPAPAPSPATAMPSPAPVAPVATPDGLVLHGVMASGAVIGFPGGAQRYVAVGGEVMPGLRLQEVRMRHAVLATATSSYRLGFGGPATAPAPAGQSSAAGAPAAPPAFSDAEAQRQAAERLETSRFRQALTPRQTNGQVTGYTLRHGFTVPALAQAGLQPGDTILAVNGSRLGAEQFEEFAWTIANSVRTELEVDRGGRRIRLAIAPN